MMHKTRKVRENITSCKSVGIIKISTQQIQIKGSFYKLSYSYSIFCKQIKSDIDVHLLSFTIAVWRVNKTFSV